MIYKYEYKGNGDICVSPNDKKIRIDNFSLYMVDDPNNLEAGNEKVFLEIYNINEDEIFDKEQYYYIVFATDKKGFLLSNIKFKGKKYDDDLRTFFEFCGDFSDGFWGEYSIIGE